MIDGVYLVLTGFNHIIAILFIFGMSFAVLLDNVLDFVCNFGGLVDCHFETGLLRCDLDIHLYIVLGLFDFVFNVEDNSGSVLLLGYLCFFGGKGKY